MHGNPHTTIEASSSETHLVQDLSGSNPSQIDHSRRLPPEILSEIFLQTLPYNRLVPFRQYASQVLRLTHVSPHWHLVGVGTPHLWTHFRFISCNEEELEVAEAWLQRSRPQPITFIVSEVNDESSGYQKALEVLVAHCARWEDATLSLPPSMTPEITSQMTNNITLLETLSIPVCSPLGIPGVFGVAPKLRSLSIMGIYDVPDFPVPWGQLTNLDIGEIYVGSCFEVLQQSPNLVKLKVAFRDGPYIVDATQIQLPSLASFEISDFWQDIPLHWLFDHLTLPSLIHFKCCGEGGFKRSAISMLSRSSTNSPLTSLDLDIRLCGALGVHDLLSRILAATPDVVDLKLAGFADDPTGGEAVIDTITITNRSRLLPKLQSLTYYPRYTIGTGSGKALVEMIESRRNGGKQGSIGRLRSVEVVVAQGAPPIQLSARVAASLSQLVAQGLLSLHGPWGVVARGEA